MFGARSAGRSFAIQMPKRKRQSQFDRFCEIMDFMISSAWVSKKKKLKMKALARRFLEQLNGDDDDDDSADDVDSGPDNSGAAGSMIVATS